ncbi:MAG: hypothetical protein NC412_05345 [Roseburia sp.]|nr:hypothetical protein [Roseburia sp.]
MVKPTTTKQINDVLSNNLLQIEKAKIYHKDSRKTESIDADTFRENFQFLCESGIFVDSIGWHYERDYKTGDYEIECGRMNAETEVIVTAYLSVGEGASREDVEKALMIVGEE